MSVMVLALRHGWRLTIAFVPRRRQQLAPCEPFAYVIRTSRVELSQGCWPVEEVHGKKLLRPGVLEDEATARTKAFTRS